MTKKLLIIRNIAHSKYKYQIFGDYELILLKGFLEDNLMLDQARILSWLKNKSDVTGGDLTTLYNENGKITIRYEYDKDDPEESRIKFETTASQLVDIINQWNALKKINLDAILIEQDDAGDVTMRAVTFDEVEDIISERATA